MYQESLITHNWLIRRIANRMVQDWLPDLIGTILDLGCGERSFAKDALQYADTYIGVDWSNTLHDLKAGVVANLNQVLPVRSNCVDHVLLFEVLEHLAEPDTMLRETFRVPKERGELTLSIPFQWWLHEAP